MKNQAYLIFVLSALILVGCNGYNQALKSDDYKLKFEMANNLYDGGQEVRSIALYEQVYQRIPKTGEGELSYFRIGKAYYIGGDYYMAGYFFGQFAQRFPSSPKAEEALFLSAMCSVQNSPQSSLDQNETELALNDLQQFINLYPNSNLIDSCNHTIDRLRFKLEEKAFSAVKQYSKTENYRAAVSSSITFVEDYPMSSFKEEISYLLVLNSYFLAKNSVENKKIERIDQTIERYRNFVAEFPESRYSGMLAKYSDMASEYRKEVEMK